MDIYVLIVMVGLERHAEYIFKTPNKCSSFANQIKDQIKTEQFKIPPGTLPPYNRVRMFCIKKKRP